MNRRSFVRLPRSGPFATGATIRLKPVAEQVVVLLGASSGIGRECALRFARRGARVVAAARGAAALETLLAEISASGGRAATSVCDVTDAAAVRALADKAVAAFGGIDTWVNCAGVGMFSRFEDTPPEDFRRVMEVNYLGQIHGALAALPHLRRGGGGALIAISSVESSVAAPLQSAYAASKHAVEGAMDALRRELMAEGVPISVTSVKPHSIATPLWDAARNRMSVEPAAPPPVYAPSVVADCVLYAAETPVRDLYAGGAARLAAAAQSAAPGLMDALLAAMGPAASRADRPNAFDEAGNLEASRSGEGRVEGWPARRASLYTWLETQPGARVAAMSAAVAGAALARAVGGPARIGETLFRLGRRGRR